MKQLLIYGQVEPINSEAHKDLCVQAKGQFEFAREVNSAPIVAAEFTAAARDFAIVFAGTDDNVVPVVILGGRENANQFVGDEGQWTASYVPAFFRRYPFVFAEAEDGTLTLCVDQEYPGLNRDGKGERLFDAEGNRTQYLATMLNFLSEYQSQFVRTKAFCDRLVTLKLLEPAQARIMQADGTARAMTGFFAVNRDKLRQISDDDLKAMFRTDELELCYVHLASLNNVAKLTAGEEPALDEPATTH